MLGLLLSQIVSGVENNIINFINYSNAFSSSGQPTEEQLKQLKSEGYQRIIYIAFNGNQTALKDEDKIVNALKMSYLHIPVDFMEPRIADFNAFSVAIKANAKIKTLLHCQVNYRASVFSFLFRVIHEGVPMATAKQDLDKIWEPNPVWFKFIETVLSKYKIKTDCEGCDWGSNEFDSTNQS